MKMVLIEGEPFEVYEDVYDLIVGQSALQDKLADACNEMLSELNEMSDLLSRDFDSANDARELLTEIGYWGD